MPRRGLARRRPAALAAYAGALMLAALAVVNPLQGSALLVLCLAVLWLAGRVRAAWPLLKTALVIGGFLALVNPLVSRGGSTVLWGLELGPLALAITVEGIAYGLGAALRIVSVIASFAVFSLLIDADDQLELLSRLSFRSGLVLSLAARLLPIVSRDAARIMDAQRARGVELDAGHRAARLAARLPLLAALLSQSLDRALDIAAAMEARGYRVRGRSRWSPGLRWTAPDVVTVAAALVAAVALLGGLASGSFTYRFYPLLDNPWVQLSAGWWLLALAALLLPVLWSAS